MRKLTILGSTGSIGVNALRIVESHPDRFCIEALAAWTNMEKLAEQIEKFRPKVVSVADAARAKELRSMIKRRVKVLHGAEGAITCAMHDSSDMVLSAMVGAAGLAPTLAAVKSGKTLALANKETMVTAGEIVMREAKAARVKIIPVDSEHSALFQALRGEKMKTLRRVILTASGGPFINTPKDAMGSLTLEQALRHPNWRMGRKITIDSATLMNKGLEVIEARWLFNLPAEKIEVVVHPESVIHSMVEFNDTSIIAQMGLPDMRAPIAFALSHPDRQETQLPTLDIATVGKLTFQPPDLERFPSLALAYDALRMGGSATAVLNAANEVAVQAFIDKRISFTAIPQVCEKALTMADNGKAATMAEALAIDRRGRAYAREAVEQISRTSPYPSRG
ncbi:MAG: 1-deoxy-D-xylulose-5-phosphate reductoisomerase [Nitrospinota bacterium]|nr:1-deoxy-D-xylulose-5-phosphate reductoisomerase [Nitrospinota bacterium]